MPAYHLAKAVGICGGTTPGAGVHYAAVYRRPMVPALCSAERVSRHLRPLIEGGAVVTTASLDAEALYSARGAAEYEQLWPTTTPPMSVCRPMTSVGRP
ncbi:MAG: hypothetical protein ACLPLP_21800 [Mycobacterium sp.]